jgi:hypothetical protein
MSPAPLPHEGELLYVCDQLENAWTLRLSLRSVRALAARKRELLALRARTAERAELDTRPA